MKELRNIGIWNVPISTKEDILKDKNFNMSIYSKTMLESNRNNDQTTKPDSSFFGERYIYKNKINNNVRPYFLEGVEKMAKKTFDKHWRYIRKVDFNLIKAETTNNGIVYRLNHKDEKGRKFVTVPSDILSKLINGTNANVIKTYLVLLYTCDKKDFKVINLPWLCEQIGFSAGSRNRMREMLEVLEDLNLIRTKLNYTEIVSVNGNEIPKREKLIKLL